MSLWTRKGHPGTTPLSSHVAEEFIRECHSSVAQNLLHRCMTKSGWKQPAFRCHSGLYLRAELGTSACLQVPFRAMSLRGAQHCSLPPGGIPGSRQSPALQLAGTGTQVSSRPLDCCTDVLSDFCPPFFPIRQQSELFLLL